MQRIERYGVIALVFLLVTILAVSLWGESKGEGWFAKLTGSSKSAENTAAAERMGRRNANRAAQLAAAGDQSGAVQVDPAAAGATPSTGTPNVAGGAAAPQTAQGGAPALLTPNAIGGTRATPPLGAPVAPNTQLAAGGAQPGATPITRGLNDKPLVNSTVVPSQTTTREYKVKSGDTLGAIAQHELGSAKRAADIQKLNNNIDPTKLMPGMTLVMPAADGKVAGANVATTANSSTGGKTIEPKTTSEAKAAVAGSRKYTVRSGDTLSVIASRELGSAKRWTEIRDLNPGVDEKSLKVSAVLTLPAGGAAKQADDGKSERVASLSPATNGRKSRVQ